MKTYKIAVIPGDGIGPEVINQGIKVIDTVSDNNDFKIKWESFDFGAERYLKTGELISEDELKELRKYDSIYLGALGDPRVKPGILEKGILLKLRVYFDQYVNLRPIRLLEGVETPLKNKSSKDIDFIVVRENTEDFYVGIGNRARIGSNKQTLDVLREIYKVKFDIDIEVEDSDIAYQIGLVSKKGSERIAEFAFEYAKKHNKNKVTSIDKANVLDSVYSLWRECITNIAKKYPNINNEFSFVDATAMWFVKAPESFQVVLCPNMFGDILTDLGAIIQGGLGLAPGGNINPNGISMFEPIHGSAPKYAGKNSANPIATIWAGALMLEELGETKASELVVNAIEAVLKKGNTLTNDLGGKATCSEMGDAINEEIG
ncbi:MAG: isocitrate/isopropylmalate dehydrogenase family protein [Nanoarchaeota archaeon]